MHAQVPWRWEALLRLFAGVLTCVLIGSWLGLLGVSYGSPQGVRIRWLALPGLGRAAGSPRVNLASLAMGGHPKPTCRFLGELLSGIGITQSGASMD